jgi:hypothetical protein
VVSALVSDVEVLHTFDTDLLGRDGKIARTDGTLLKICKPPMVGQPQPLLDSPAEQMDTEGADGAAADEDPTPTAPEARPQFLVEATELEWREDEEALDRALRQIASVGPVPKHQPKKRERKLQAMSMSNLEPLNRPKTAARVESRVRSLEAKYNSLKAKTAKEAKKVKKSPVRALLVLALASSCASPPSNMWITTFTSCGPGFGVHAYDVGPNDDPIPKMDAAALAICRDGYDIASGTRLRNEVGWAVECHPKGTPFATLKPPPKPC